MSSSTRAGGSRSTVSRRDVERAPAAALSKAPQRPVEREVSALARRGRAFCGGHRPLAGEQGDAGGLDAERGLAAEGRIAGPERGQADVEGSMAFAAGAGASMHGELVADLIVSAACAGREGRALGASGAAA